MSMFEPYYPMSEIYKNGVIKQLQINKKLDEFQAVTLFEKYYLPIYKQWGMEPNVEEFAAKIQKIDELVHELGGTNNN